MAHQQEGLHGVRLLLQQVQDLGDFRFIKFWAEFQGGVPVPCLVGELGGGVGAEGGGGEDAIGGDSR